MFSGIGTGEKGIEQAFNNQYESTIGRPTNGTSGRFGATDIGRDGILSANDSALCNGGGQGMLECIGFSEIDKHAEAIYRFHFDHKNYGDATGIIPDELPGFDFLIAGFPCQAFSIAGKRQGFDDARGTLFFEIARILSHKRPSHFLLENVRGLLSHDGGKTLHTILGVLSELGYFVELTVLNSKDFGVPQNRERCFFIGHLGGECGREILSFGDGNGESFAESNGAGNDIAHTITNGDKQRGSYIVEPAVTVGTLRTHKDGEGFREMKSNVAPALNARARQDRSQQGVNVQQLEPRSDGLTNTITSVEKDNLVVIGDFYAEQETRPDQILSHVQKANVPSSREGRRFTINSAFHEAGLLRPRMYESRYNEAEETQPDLFDGPLSLAQNEAENRSMRAVPLHRSADCDPSSQSQLEGQPHRESTGDLQRMPRIRSQQTGEVPSAEMRRDSSALRILREAQPEVQEIWKPADVQAKSTHPDYRIRRLTVTECERLQGLPDGYTAFGRYGDEIREVADTNRYKGLGNAFTVNVIEAIITKMLERGCLK